MKKFIIALFSALLFSGCGVGSYSVSSGRADEGMISFVSSTATTIRVIVDNNTYDINTVKTKAWRKERNIKNTAKNTIIIPPGQHHVTVYISGDKVYSKKVFISTQEHKIIEL